jgi:2'-5' RNA ligase
MKTRIYFIALVPPQEIREEVTQFKLYASEHFNAAHALKSPPHITLFPPFRWALEKETKLQEAVSHFVVSQTPFWVWLEDFDHFGQRVIFVNVIPGEELLGLQKDLKAHLDQTIDLKQADSRPFHPHMTVAFKDLKPDRFEEAWAYFSQQSYERAFEADQLCLLKHDGKQWQIIQREPIGKH